MLGFLAIQAITRLTNPLDPVSNLQNGSSRQNLASYNYKSSRTCTPADWGRNCALLTEQKLKIKQKANKINQKCSFLLSQRVERGDLTLPS